MEAALVLARIFAISNAPFTLYNEHRTPVCFMPDTAIFRKLSALAPLELLQTQSGVTLGSAEELLAFGAVSLPGGMLAVFGPFTAIACGKAEARRILCKIGSDESEIAELIDFFSISSAGGHLQLANTLELVNYVFNGEAGQISVATEEDGHSDTERLAEELEHNSERYERTLFSFIENGQPEKLDEFLTGSSFKGRVGDIARDYIRKYKNLSIVSIALASRAAVRGGLHYDAALQLSDDYLQAVESAFDIKTLMRLNRAMLRQFAQRVQSTRTAGYSRFVLEVDNYILRHLSTKLTGEMIAKRLNMNRSYLCQKYKSETGTSLGERIASIKMDEAKRLLSSAEHSVLDVALTLDYSSQSSFHRAFKAHTGMTPKQWREGAKKSRSLR